MGIWYRVRDLEAARAFYRETLGFEEAYVDEEDRWARLVRGSAEVALAEGEPQEEETILTLDVEDVKAEASRLRDRALRLYLRARDFGLRGLEVDHRGLAAQLQSRLRENEQE